MVWIVLVLVAVLVVVATAAVATGRLAVDPMAEPVASAPDHGLPAGRPTADAVDGVHFDTALRGYRMDQVDEVLDRLQERIAELESTQHAARLDDRGGPPSDPAVDPPSPR